MNKDYQVAILLKKDIEEANKTYYKVDKILIGKYDNVNYCFVDKSGKKYKHIIENEGEYGFCWTV